MINLENRAVVLVTSNGQEYTFDRVTRLTVAEGVVMVVYGEEEDSDVFIMPTQGVRRCYSRRTSTAGMM